MTTAQRDHARMGEIEPDIDVELVTFRAGDAMYALRIGAVREVIRMVAITPVPGAPEWCAGLLNLRGQVVPVLDLRYRIGLSEARIFLSTPIIVTEDHGRRFGVIVDEVAQMVVVPADAVQPIDDPGSDAIVTAVVRQGSNLVMLCDAAVLARDAYRYMALAV